MKILGIDYGSKRIGLAISDENQTMAFPKEVLSNDKKTLDVIKEIIGQENVSEVVIGESKDYKMKDNEIMNAVNSFKKDLEEKLNIEVILHPELMTSMQVEKMMGEKNKMIDASAAAIMLQNYLDFKEN
jgi:putative Holliday junction resolvase